MKQLLDTLRARFPELRFTAGQRFSWSPQTGEVIYKRGASGEHARWSLLHETGHALLDHHSYGLDFELLCMEVDAWQQAKTLAADVGIAIDENHIQDCLDTYRDWLYRRSICPDCGTKCLQTDNAEHYRCHNCHASWRVSANRFARTYRRQTAAI